MISAACAISYILQLYGFAMGLRFDHVEENEGVCWAWTATGEEDLLIFRGSVTLEDWARDLCAVSETTDHPLLGPVHKGFWAGMDEALPRIAAFMRPRAALTSAGHSLGGARAFYAAVLLDRCRRVYAFGAPRPSIGPRLGAALARDSLDARAYRNGADVVPLLPPGPLDWRQPAPVFDLCEPPAIADWLDHLGWHHATLYAKAFGVSPP